MSRYSIVFLFLLPVTANTQLIAESDSCNSITFREYISINGNLVVLDVKQYTDNGYIIVGSLREVPSLSITKAFISRLTENGDIIWFKTFGFNTSFTSCEFYKLAITQDNNVVVCATSSTITNEFNSFIKFDIDGNIIWKKSYNTGSSSGMILSIKAATDGGLFYSGVYATSGAIVGKLTASGDITWSKLYGNNGYMNALDILESNNSLYFTGTDYTITYSGSHILKLNKFTGDTVWSRSYGKTSGSYLVQFSDLSMQEDNLIVNGVSNINNIPGSNDQAIFKIDTSGNLIEATQYKLVGQDIVYGLFQYPEYNNTVKVGMQSPSIDSNDLYFFQLRNNQLSGFTANITGRQDIRTLTNCSDSGFMAGITCLGYAPLFWQKTLLVKNSFSGSDANCTYIPASYSVSPVTINVDYFHSGGSNFGDMQTSTVTELTSPSVNIEKLCMTLSNCRLGEFTGPDSVCTNQSVYFNISVFGNCNNAVFTIDSSFATILDTTNNIVHIQFNMAGIVYLIASLNTPCGIKKDSMAIHIFPSSQQLSLGPDYSLCPNNTKILNAQTGYISYLWQDGSTDSTFNVTAPGLYWVEVKDACDNIFRDTVIVSAAPPVPLDIGPDLSKCNSDSLTITAPPDFINYSWSPNYNITTTSGPVVSVFPSIDTMYKLTAEKTPGCFAFDSVRIMVKFSPPINLGSDASFCNGDSLILNAGGGFTNYQWSTGQTSPVITLYTTGTYIINAMAANGCISKDTLRILNVFNNPVINLGPDSPICEGITRQLNAGAGFNNYLWNNGSTSQSIFSSIPGTYWVIVTDNNNCKGGDTTVITSIIPAPKNFLPADTVLCSYSSMSLSPLSSYNAYLWSTGSNSPSIVISNPGNYWLQVTSPNGCTGKDTIIVNPKQCLDGFYIPGAFTPNNDGKNDLFKPLLFGNVLKYEFIIYNRWGEIVFRTKDLQKGWDGKVNGSTADTYIFVWQCNFQFESKAPESRKGTVALIH